MERTPETYRHHLDHTVHNCSSTWTLLKQETVLGTEYIIVPKLCKSNYCTYCRPRNLARLRQALYRSLKHKAWRLVTLTYPDHTVDKLMQLKATARQFKRLIQRIKRRYPNLTYIRTIELHQSDFPHLHMIVDRYIPAAFITKAWHDLGGGRTDIITRRRCPDCGTRGNCPHQKHPQRLNYKDAADYLTDEIQKAQQDPHQLGVIYWLAHVRSITTSRNFNLTDKTSAWQYVGTWPDPTDAWNFVNDMHAGTDPHNKNPLTVHDLKDGLAIGHGYPDPM